MCRDGKDLVHQEVIVDCYIRQSELPDLVAVGPLWQGLTGNRREMVHESEVCPPLRI